MAETPIPLGEALDELKANRSSEEAWRALYWWLRPYVVVPCYRKGVRDRNLIEEVVQDTLIGMYKYCRFNAIDNEEELKAYTTAVAKRMLSHRAARQRPQEVSSETLAQLPSAPVNEVPEDEGVPAPFRVLPQEIDRVLNASEKELIDLFASGYRIKFAANKLGITEGAVRVRMSRIHRKLREAQARNTEPLISSEEGTNPEKGGE